MRCGCRLSVTFLLVLALLPVEASARKRRRSYRQPTHPVVLWARTLTKSQDLEQRRVAAFKLSQYSQRIYQSSIISTLKSCVKDPDIQIKIFCTKALGNAHRKDTDDSVRLVLLNRYQMDEELKSTVIRTFIKREDDSKNVHETLLKDLDKTKDPELILVLMEYFEKFGDGSVAFVDTLGRAYYKVEDSKMRRAVIKALSEQGKGQSNLIDLLANCAVGSDTPLALTCLSGIEVQAKNDPRAWNAIETNIKRDDPDVLLATLDVIIDLPETENGKIGGRLRDIIEDAQDPEMLEKSVLALGATGDKSLANVETLLKLLKNKGTYDAVRVAAALSLGQQAITHSSEAKPALEACKSDAKSQSLKTACQLGLVELENRTKIAENKKTTSKKN